MEKTEKITNDYYVIDVTHIVKVVWRNIWVVIVLGILVAAIGFSVASFAIAPTYASSVMLYVNNSSFSVGDVGFSISSSQLVAAQNLAKTYTVLLKNRTTLERIIEETGVDYSWQAVYGMIETTLVNETEVIQVTVTCEDPDEAEKIANGIARVLPQRVAEIVAGASMEVVDSGIVNTSAVAPSITMYTAVGFVLGVLLAVGILTVSALMDNTVHDEEYVINTYNLPILAKVPNLLDGGSKKYGYYYNRYYKYGSNRSAK